MIAIILFALAGVTTPDSLRLEIINGKPVVIHQVGEKETLFSLARRYGTTVNSILEMNPTADGGLEIGQILKVPYVGRAKTGVAVKTQNGLVHKVVAKETLFSIARLYNVSVDDLRSWNSLTDAPLAVGQEIIVRKGEPTPTPPVVAPTEVKAVVPGAKTHTVEPKETLYSISKMYGMTVPQLQEWNNLGNNELRIGQVLTVAAPTALGAPGAVAVGVPMGTTTQSSPAIVPAKSAPTASTTIPAVSVPSAQPTMTVVPTIHVSEGVNGSTEIKETGMAALLGGTEGNRKYLAQHRNVGQGAILKIRNLMTNQEVFVRVTGPPAAVDDDTIILISKSAYDRLGSTEGKFRVELTYYK